VEPITTVGQNTVCDEDSPQASSMFDDGH